MQGIYAASVTPFDAENKVNTKALVSLMRRNLSEGADGFFIGGSSAECFLLTEDERIQTFETASEFKNETSLVAHVGAISTDQAIRFAKCAVSLGFSHIAATPPFYYGFGAEQIAEYYKDIAQAAGMPVIVYNFPGNTGKPFDLNNPVIVELFRSDAVYGIKHTNLDLFQLERIKRVNPRLVMMNGFDETMAAGIALGADGSIGSTFNFMLPHYRKLYDACRAGRSELALELQIKANDIMQTICRAGLIPSIKYILKTQGIDAGCARKPFNRLSNAQMLVIDEILAKNLVK